ncbi:MAG: phage tail assembly chaperone [Pseudolabrys sp.]|nr:phage tail assembly chaperone [Pseudolabrys sp.]
MKPFPWPEAIGFGLGVLKLPPEQFWRMTPRELSYAIEAVRGGRSVPLDRGGLADLMKRFPDER